jgi:hypothetical protein
MPERSGRARAPATRVCLAVSGQGEIGCLSTRYKISSNRTNDRSWMTGLGCLAMDGVVLPNSPAEGE